MSDTTAAAPSAPAPSAPSTPAPSAPASATSAPVTTKAPTPATPGATTPAPTTAAERRQYKGKVDKEEKVWELSDEEVSIRLQKAEAAEKRFQEAAQIKKQWAQLQQIAKEDPALLLKELGGADPLEWATKQVEEKWKLEVMPEHERQVYELNKKIQAYEAQEAKRKQAEEMAARDQAAQAYEAQIEKDFQEAFALSGLEWTPDNVEEFGKLIMTGLENDLQYTPAQLAAESKARIAAREQKYQAKAKEQIVSMKGEQLLEFLGEAAVKEVVRAAVAKHQPKVPSVAEVPVSPANANTKTQDRDGKGRYLTTADWRKSFGRG